MNPSTLPTKIRKEGRPQSFASLLNQYGTRPDQGYESDDGWGYGKSSSKEGILNSRKPEGWRYLVFDGGLSRFLFTTSFGWQLFIGILVSLLWGCGIALIVTRRIVLWSVYLKENYTSHTRLLYLLSGCREFPYVLTTTWIELVLAHGWIVLSAHITKWMAPWLRSAGLSGMIAPSKPLQVAVHDVQGGNTDHESLGNILNRFSTSSGVIAGEGLFEFDLLVVRQVFPIASIFVVGFWLSILSFTHAQYPIYVLARVGIIPCSILFTTLLGRTKYRWPIVSSALVSAIALGLSIYHPSLYISRKSIAFGVISSVFSALYPVQMARTYKALLASLVPQGDDLRRGLSTNSCGIESSGSQEEAKAYWQLLQYTSLLSILISTPVVLLFGQIPSFWKEISSLDFFFYWMMVTCGSLASWAVLFSTIALTRATSPLTATFIFVPEASLTLAIMIGKRLPARSWIALSLCWVSCGLYLLQRRKEAKS